MSETKRKMTGKVCLYRPKVRQPRALQMTREGHVLLDRYTQQTGLRRGDFVESLIRKYGHLIDGAYVELPKGATRP